MVLDQKKDGDKKKIPSATSQRIDNVVLPRPKILEQAPKSSVDNEPDKLMDILEKANLIGPVKSKENQENVDTQVVVGTDVS